MAPYNEGDTAMNDAAPRPTEPAAIAAVAASMPYSVDTGTKPVNDLRGPLSRIVRRSATIDPHVVTIRDGRPHRATLELDECGFELVDHRSAITDFFDQDQIDAIYNDELAALIRERTGAARVLVFDHTIRAGDRATQIARDVRQPVRLAHNDYTARSAAQRVRDLVGADEAEALLANRFAVIQVWRPIGAPVVADPLAICDARTLAPGDLIAADLRYADRMGEIYQIAYNPEHRWYYFPRMTRDEAVIFKVYDSDPDVTAAFTAHSAFRDPTSAANALPRQSMEVRTLAFWD